MLHSIFQSDAAPDEEILRQADYNLSRVSRAVRNPRAKEKFLYPAYQLRDTSHRDLVKGAKTGSRSSLTKRFDGCLMHNKGAFTSFSNLYRQGLFRVELRAICKVIWYFLSIEATTSCSRRSEGNGDLKNEYERERKEEIMSRTWSNRQDRKCALSTPIIGIYPFPRSFFLLIKPISPRRARKKERETSLLYSYILGIMDRDLEREAWDKASLSLVTPWWNSQFSVQDRSYICKKWGWNVRSGNTHSLRSLERQQRFNKLLKGLLHATHETLNSGGARLRRSSRIDSSQRGRVLRLFSVKGDRYCTVVIHRRLAVTREGHLTRRKGLRRRRIRKRGDKEADDIHRLPTFHSSLVVPFHAKITGLLPHEYV